MNDDGLPCHGDTNGPFQSKFAPFSASVEVCKYMEIAVIFFSVVVNISHTHNSHLYVLPNLPQIHKIHALLQIYCNFW